MHKKKAHGVLPFFVSLFPGLMKREGTVPKISPRKKLRWKKQECFSRREASRLATPREADPISEKNRKQNWKMGFQTGDRIS